MRHWAEEVAREYLLARGYRLLAQNYTVRGGEIDLVMEHGTETVFVEVRQRRRDDYGGAAESIDGRKLRLLRRAAEVFLRRRYPGEVRQARIDAVLVHGSLGSFRIEHLEGIG